MNINDSTQKKLKQSGGSRQLDVFSKRAVGGDSSGGVHSDLLSQSCETVKKFCSDLF